MAVATQEISFWGAAASDRYRRILVITGRYGEGLLTEPTGAAQPRRQEPHFLTQKPTLADQRQIGSVGW